MKKRNDINKQVKKIKRTKNSIANKRRTKSEPDLWKEIRSNWKEIRLSLKPLGKAYNKFKGKRIIAKEKEERIKLKEQEEQRLREEEALRLQEQEDRRFKKEKKIKEEKEKRLKAQQKQRLEEKRSQGEARKVQVSPMRFQGKASKQSTTFGQKALQSPKKVQTQGQNFDPRCTGPPF